MGVTGGRCRTEIAADGRPVADLRRADRAGGDRETGAILAEFIDDHKIVDPVIIGHSMGGKTAMNFALAHPDKIDKLIVVDISPRAYDLEHYVILQGLNAIAIEKVQSRKEADEILAQHVAEPDVRQFLLKNLQRKDTGGFSWKINLPVLTRKLGNIGLDLQVKGTFTKPTLFIRGARSNYVQDADWTRISTIFPEASLEETALLADAVRIGKGLQLVNILRDNPGDTDTQLRVAQCFRKSST